VDALLDRTIRRVHKHSSIGDASLKQFQQSLVIHHVEEGFDVCVADPVDSFGSNRLT
jgi:hypothetical protein